MSTIKIVKQTDSDKMPARDWLSLAKSKIDTGRMTHLVHGEFATDHVRLHVAEHEDPCDLKGCDELHKKIREMIIEKPRKHLFFISRQFLIEALAGIASDVIEFSEIEYGADSEPIVIDGQKGRYAVIMPIINP
jgi:hypothetical protein